MAHATRDDDGGASFDGIICIGGEDWWYHNRGHFDFQIMRRLAERWPVLFINSLGVRMPALSDKSRFAAKFGRKLRSLVRGLVNVENNFWVFSPLSVPGPAGERVSGWALAPQIRLAAARAGISRPLLWVHCPAGAGLIDEIPHVGLVFQRTDRFEAFPEALPGVVATQIARLKAAADLTIYCNADLMAAEAAEVGQQLLVTHGVDVEMFVSAGRARAPGPIDVATLPRPRVGFVGGIDAHTFAPELFLQTAARLDDVTFVLVGGCSLPKDWCGLDNVHQLGRKPYDLVASYMAAMDVLIMPWNDSEWIRACNPIKLKEYLAVGRPIVSTDFPALAKYRDLVRIARTPDEFASEIRAALATSYSAGTARARVATESWDDKAQYLAEFLVELFDSADGRQDARFESSPSAA